MPAKSTTTKTNVCTEYLNPDVVVMKSAKDRARPNASGPLNGARDWRIFSQGPVGSDVVVIASIGSQDSAQMRLTQDDEMVDTLAPDRADQPSAKPFCHGEAGAVGLSRMPMTRSRRVKTVL